MLKRACAGVVLFASSCLAQNADTAATLPAQASQDPVVSRSLQAMGMPLATDPSITSFAKGKLTLVGENPLTGAVTFQTRGPEKIRSEFEASDGTVVRIVNAGAGTIQFPGKAPRKLSPKNTLFAGVRHIPALSRLSTAASRSPKDGTPLDPKLPLMAEAAFKNPGTASTDAALVEVTKQRFEIDPVTGYVTKLSFTAFGDDDHMTRSRTDIVYSDYRPVQGIAVPFKQQRYVEGVLREEIQFDTVEFNVSIPDSDFALPEVKE